MKPVFLALGALVVLSACNDPSDDAPSLYANCVSVLSDPELSAELIEASTTADAACTCLEARIAGEDETEEMIGLFFARLSDFMDESELGAEDAAGRLAARSILDDSDSDSASFAETMPVFNDVFEKMMRDVEANEGACPDV